MRSLFLICVLLFLCALISLSGCKAGCAIQDTIKKSLSGALATNLQCKNKDQIQIDIEKIMSVLNLCPQEQALKGTIATMSCPIVAHLGVAYLGEQIPQSWECDPQMAQAGLTALVISACNKLPF